VIKTLINASNPIDHLSVFVRVGVVGALVNLIIKKLIHLMNAGFFVLYAAFVSFRMANCGYLINPAYWIPFKVLPLLVFSPASTGFIAEFRFFQQIEWKAFPNKVHVKSKDSIWSPAL